MEDAPRPIGLDSTGYEVLTKAVLALLSEYGELVGREIYFEDIGQSGIAFSADDGALIMSETPDILGGYTQTCQYPFYVVYRTASTQESQKLNVQTFLDSLGKWLCGEPAKVNGKTEILDKYPALTDGRKITRITRLNSYGLEPNADGVQDWLLPVTVQYTNEIAPKW